MSIPNKITPCPIIDCNIELRFRTTFESGAIFGIVYNAFKNLYPDVEKMPILNIPEEIRIADPNLRYQALYKLTNGGFVLATGPRVVTLGKSGEYPGWSQLSERLRRMVEIFSGLEFVEEVERIGLRYINFFEFDIFEKIKLTVEMGKAPITKNETLVRSIFPGNRYKSKLQVANHVTVIVDGVKRKGSIIDIDTSLDRDIRDFFRDSNAIIEEGHNEEKELFFSLLETDFLQTLNPEY